MRVDEVIAAFGAAWNTADDAERLRLLTVCCLPDAVFAAPQGQITGIDVLSASIGEFRRAFPAARVAFGAQLAADGRIQILVSFDGTPAPADA